MAVKQFNPVTCTSIEVEVIPIPKKLADNTISGIKLNEIPNDKTILSRIVISPISKNKNDIKNPGITKM